MGCFLGCFGLSSKRKRRKPANRVQPGDTRFCSYEPLDSATASLDVKEKPLFNLDSELKDESKKTKEPFGCKIRKKVSFNLNVQTYEPIQKEEDDDSDHFPGSDGDEESSKKETAKRRESEGDSTASYPSNYRYRNCIHSYDDEEEDEFAESDLDDYYYDDDDFEDDLEEEEDDEKLKSVSVNRDSLTNRNAGDRSEYAHSVLKPVENLSQWKAVKAKAKPPVKQQREKENVALESRPVLQQIAVDTSLSNWLGCESKNSIIQVENISSFPWRRRSREDMPILDFTSTI